MFPYRESRKEAVSVIHQMLGLTTFDGQNSLLKKKHTSLSKETRYR